MNIKTKIKELIEKAVGEKVEFSGAKDSTEWAYSQMILNNNLEAGHNRAITEIRSMIPALADEIVKEFVGEIEKMFPKHEPDSLIIDKHWTDTMLREHLRKSLTEE